MSSSNGTMNSGLFIFVTSLLNVFFFVDDFLWTHLTQFRLTKFLLMTFKRMAETNVFNLV